MNEFAAYPQPVPGGWRVMVRFAKDGNPKPIMDVGNKPLVLPCQLEATQTALKHLLAYLNGDYRRCGETLSKSLADRKEIDRIFAGGGKVIRVEKVRARA